MGFCNVNVNGNNIALFFNVILNKFLKLLRSSLQYNTTIENGLWIDNIGSNTRDVFEGGAYAMNGTDNYIDTGSKVTGGTAINVKVDFITTDSTKTQGIFGCGGYASSAKGVMMYITGGELRIFSGDGVAAGGPLTGVTISNDVLYELEFAWSGNVADQASLTVNGSTTTHTLPYDWVGDSNNNLLIGAYGVSLAELEGYILEFAYTINGNAEVKHVCEETSGSISYSNTAGKVASILGTTANVHTSFANHDSQANTIGYGLHTSLPGVIIPLDTDGVPVVPYTTLYTGRAKYNLNLEDSYAFEFNGTDNYLQTNNTIDLNNPFYLEINFKHLNSGTGMIYSNGGYSTTNGFHIYTSSNVLNISYANGSTNTVYTTSITLTVGQYHTLICEWDGNLANPMYFTVGAQTDNTTIDVNQSVNSLYPEMIGAYMFGGVNNNIIVNYVKLTSNGESQKFIPFSLGNGSNVYDVESDTAHSISGTVSAANWILQDEYHFNVNNGFTLSGSTYIPASNLTAGKDVLGADLANPVILNTSNKVIGHNSAETLLVQNVVPDLVNADKISKWFNYGFSFNGTDNYVQTALYNVGSKRIRFESKFTYRAAPSSSATLFSSGAQVASRQGISILVMATTHEVRLLLSDGVSLQSTYTGIIFPIGETIDFDFDWNGLVGVNNIKITVNGVTSTFDADYAWTGNSYYEIRLGVLVNGLYELDADVNYMKLTTNDLEYLFSFNREYGNIVTETINDVDYEISGTTFDWIDVTAKQLTFDDLNDNNKYYDFINVMDAENDLREHLLFSTIQPIETTIEIDEFYLSSHTLPDGYEWAQDSATGEYLLAPITHEYYYIPE